MLVSDCCGAPAKGLSEEHGICVECKEHCEYHEETEEETKFVIASAVDKIAFSQIKKDEQRNP